MQPPTADPRLALTTDQVVWLIQGAPAITVSCGLELLGQDLRVVEDITRWLRPQGSSVARASYADLHGTATLLISTELDWGRAIVRPTMTLSDGVDAATFRLGAYYTSSPLLEVGSSLTTHTVACYDILHGLYGLAGEVYAVDAGEDYLGAVETILIDQGYSAYIIDQEAAGSVLPAPRVWPLDNQTRWVHIVNDLLGAVGYQGIWSDWDGRLRCQPYVPPSQRGPEWTYDTDPLTSTLGRTRTIEADYFNAPNRWVGVRSNNVDGPAPIEGDGMFTYINEFDGPTSVAARGRIITAELLSLDVADQAALETGVMARVDADLSLKVTVDASTGPNPLHWHFDRVYLNDPGIGVPVDALVTQWAMPLTGGAMTHQWTVL